MSLKIFIFIFRSFKIFQLTTHQGVIYVLILSNLSNPFTCPTQGPLTEELRQRPHMVLLNSPKVCLAALVV